MNLIQTQVLLDQLALLCFFFGGFVDSSIHHIAINFRKNFVPSAKRSLKPQAQYQLD